MKKYFVVKLIANTPINPMGMTAAQQEIMGKHMQYWQVLMDKGYVLVVGPVLDPAGSYGLGIIAVESREQLDELLKNDPALQIARHEVAEMLAIVPK